MYTTKLKLLLSGTAIACAIFLLPSQATASSWNFYDKGSKDSCDKGSKGSYDRGSKDSCDKGSKGSYDRGSKGSCDKGSKGSYDRGSKGSCDKGSKGSYDRGSKGSCDKGSKGSCDRYDMINTGIVRGNVYQDFNQNGIKDLNESGIAGIKVTIVDANNTMFVTYTDTNGTYIQKGVSEGEALVTVDDTTLPMHAELTAGLNPSTVMVVPYIDTMQCSDYIYNYEKNCTMDANTNYNKYNKYMNHNRSYDNEKNCTIDTNTSYTKYKKYMNHNRSYDNDKNCTIDTNTSYTKYKKYMNHNRSYDNDKNCTIDTNTSHTKYNKYMDNNCTIIYSDAGDDGYTFPNPVGTTCGSVYEDANQNNMKDFNETGTFGIKINLIDANGDTNSTFTDNNGSYCFYNVVEGQASIEVDITTLPMNATLTAGMNPNDVMIVANQNNDAGTDGYTFPLPTGDIYGFVTIDGNGYGGITVFVTDSTGVVHTAVTDSSGRWELFALPVGEVIVDIDETTLPDDTLRTIGEDLDSYIIVAGESVNAMTDGYTFNYTP